MWVGPLVEVPCFTEPPPKSHWMAITERHDFKREGEGGTTQIGEGKALSKNALPEREKGGGGKGVWELEGVAGGTPPSGGC